jgi:inositol hexakisphosphate/diphosphoinositol-pentakisphosphate kinase
MKMHVCHPLFLEYYEARTASGSGAKKKKTKDLKIKAVSDLEKLLDVSKKLLAKHDTRDPEFMEFLAERERGFDEDATERVQGYRTLRDVLQRWRLVGINRKVQLKPKEIETDEDGKQCVRKLLLIIKWGGDLTHMGEEQAELLGQKFRRMMYPGGEGGLNRLHSTFRHDLKIYTSDEGRVQKTAASFAKGLLELEGDLIPILVGLVLKSKDADSMLDQSGSSAQEIIMKVKQRLHKIIHRDDHCSQLLDSESRLIRSVALALQQVDQPIKKMSVMHQLLKSLKEQLTRMLHEKAQLRAELSKRQAQTAQTDLRPTIPAVERSLSVSSMSSNPRRRHMHAFSQEEEEERSKRRGQRIGGRGGGIDAEVEFKYPEPCGRETLEVMRERWAKLYRDFFIKKTDTYDLSKIPDIHDCIRYDALHNSHLNLRSVRELLDIAASLAHALVPQEYGINVNEKVAIGSAMCRTLLMKIKDDLDLARGLELHSTHRLNPNYVQNKNRIKSTHRAVRTRLYFTSESHLHTLLNVLRYGREDCPVRSPVGDEAKKWIEGIPEFCYMTHFVVRVFERFQFAKTDPQRFRLEVSLSPGADQDPLTFDMDKHLEVAPLKIISREDLTCQEVVDYLSDTIAFAEHNELAGSSKAPSGRESPVDGAVRGSTTSGSVSEEPSPTPIKRTEYFISNASSASSNDGE